MAAVRFSEDELAALSRDEWACQISHEAKVLYMLVIRPHMDFANGMAGRKTVISYQKIAEALEFDPPAGSKREARRFQKEKIRALLKELVRGGLIEWVKNPERGLLFRCLMADTDWSVSQRNNPGATPEQPQSSNPEEDPGSNPEESQQIAASGEAEQPQEHPQEEPGSNPDHPTEEQPTSGGPVFRETTATPTSPEAPAGASVTPHPATGQQGAAKEVFDYWVWRMGKGSQTRFTKDRKQKVEARLREGYTPDELKLAIDGCASSDFHMGANDEGKKHNDLELICRKGSKVENFMERAQGPQRPKTQADRRLERNRESSAEAAIRIKGRRHAT